MHNAGEHRMVDESGASIPGGETENRKAIHAPEGNQEKGSQAAGKPDYPSLIEAARGTLPSNPTKQDIRQHVFTLDLSYPNRSTLLRMLYKAYNLSSRTKKPKASKPSSGVSAELLGADDDVKLQSLLDEIYLKAQSGDAAACKLWIEYAKTHIQQDISDVLREQAVSVVNALLEDRAHNYCDKCRSLYKADMQELMEIK